MVSRMHAVRLLPAQFVKLFLKSNKNDYPDGEAIAEAMTRACGRVDRLFDRWQRTGKGKPPALDVGKARDDQQTKFHIVSFRFLGCAKGNS